MLADGTLPADRRVAYSHLLVEEADRISAMLEELLDYTRGRRTSLRPSRVTVPALVEKLESWIATELGQRGIGLKVELTYDGPIIVDLDRMKRALLNVATNAMDSMDKGGTLTIASRMDSGTVELSLSDTGRGIPAELQARVFEPFFTHGKKHGLGLGMTITRKIVEEHGGEVRITSTPGQGTRLCFRLPEAPPEMPPEAA
jgi:two-component system sensor histidine kinase AtoS